VVIPVFNQVHLTERCLDSLLAHRAEGSPALKARVDAQPDFLATRHLVIVDNHSTDSTPDVLARYKVLFERQGWKWTLLRNSENVGFGRAMNQGFNATQAPFVALLNNDTWLMPGWDQVLLRRIQELQADMIGPYYDETPFEKNSTLEKSKKFIQKNRNRYRPAWVSILMLFKRESFEKIGKFDERFFLTFEDTDLRERMDRAGMKYYQVADCFIWHHSKGTRGAKENLNVIPNTYEQEGLRLFQEKWGFDPRKREQKRLARLKRRWEKIKVSMQWF